MAKGGSKMGRLSVFQMISSAFLRLLSSVHRAAAA
jgi:hypothetical protein